MKYLVINQPRGLGDILFCVPLVRSLKGNLDVLWPVVPSYLNIQKHFPDIRFIDFNLVKIDYDCKEEFFGEYGRVLPLRWADEICKLDYTHCMKAKYMMYGNNWQDWRNLSWARDYSQEDRLYYNVLGLNEEPFNLINCNFGTGFSNTVDIVVENGIKNVYMKNIPEFTLMDWSKVIEKAKTIHTVGSSINYLIEILEISAEEICLFIRHPIETDFSYYDYILTKKYKLVGVKPKII